METPANRSGVAAVLFTDLVASTELMAALGDAAFDRLRNEHLARLSRAVEEHGGTVVKNTGDGLMATFGSSVEALAAAVGSQQAAAAHSADAQVPFEIRVGLAIGEVSFEAADVFGTPVVEAARLVEAARPGQILCTALVRAMAGSRAPSTCIELGARDLKGLPEPVAVCEVAWAALVGSEPLPLPPLLTGGGRVFVGREDEVAHLHQLWKEVQAGDRRLALLGGEPGVGKTRLATELARGLHGDGALVLAGRCDEDLGVPYQPFVEALYHYVTQAPERRLGRHPGELSRLVPELGQLVPGLPEPLRSDPETERYRLFDAVALWLSDVSAASPVLLVLDDLQWAAKPTLLLLRHILRSPEPARLLVVGTYRDTELGRGHPLTELLANLRRDGTLERFALTGLDHSGVIAFMEQAAGHDLDDESLALARVVHAETAGNPLFVSELLRDLAETGAIARRAGRWETRTLADELAIPEGVREVIGQRLSRLSEAANRVLTVAAVVGPEFEPAVLELASGLDEEAVLTALEEATAARLLAPGSAGRFRFAQNLVRATLYEEISSPRRVVLHRKVAEAIETLHAGRLDDYLPALSHHFSRAAAPAAATSKAVTYTARAGHRALALLAHDEAVSYYQHALDLLDASEASPDEGQRLELLISLGEAQRRGGDPAHRQTLLDAGRLAQRQGDSAALARAALANSRGNLFSSVGAVDTERVAALEAALEAVGEQPSAMRARLLAYLSQEVVFLGDEQRCLRLSDEALALARRLGDASALADVLVARYHAIAFPSTLLERVANTAELMAVAERLDDPLLLSRALWLRYRAVLESGDVDEARRCHAQSERISAELGQPVLRWLDQWNRDGLVLLAGRVREAEHLVQEASELGREIGQPDTELLSTAQLFQVRFEQGRLAEMEAAIASLVAEVPEFPLLRAIQAVLFCELGRNTEARDVFEDLAGDDFALVPLNVYWLRTMTDAAAVCAGLGDTARAAVLFDLLAPYAEQLVVALRLITGSVSHYLGLLATTLARFDEAEARFTTAEATHLRIEAPTWLARTRLEWARMLLTRHQAGDAEQARELLGQAMTTARDLGLAKVEGDAVALLQ